MATIVSIKNLTDYQVMNPLGQTLGHVADVVLEPDLKTARYFVLSFGGMLGMGDKLFAVPVDGMHLDTENECLVLDVEREQLKSAPGFDKRRPPAAADAEIGRAIYRFDHTAPSPPD